jgi:hypothetical protein
MNQSQSTSVEAKSTLSPIIIIGMHRSGTSMITRMLETMGLFVGKDKDANHEALFFRRIDLWLFSQCGGSWEHPQPIHHLVENAEVRSMTTDYITRYKLQSPRAISYLGLRKYLRYRTPTELRIPWGWKSPLSTYTLPLWLDIFPGAKVIHIYRHGVDVANSLRARLQRDKNRTRIQQLYYNLPMLHWIRPKAGGFVESVRCASLEGGLSLWEEYLTEAHLQVSNLGERAMELKYEDFLAEPSGALQRLATFCNLSISKSDLERAAGNAQKERAYAYLANPELRAFADRVRGRLAKFDPAGESWDLAVQDIRKPGLPKSVQLSER